MGRTRVDARIATIGAVFVLGVVALLGGALWQVASVVRPPPDSTADPGILEPVSDVDPLAVLHDWDAQRARAWATADVAGLRALYLPGSRSGRADTGRLRRWAARGLVVTDLRTQVLDVETVRADADRLVLLVTDRIVGGVARGRGADVPLPRDGATRWRMTFVARDGRWLLRESWAADP